ncbi:hypothetical protein MRX96_001265 [Rhipicephalus microplus]
MENRSGEGGDGSVVSARKDAYGRVWDGAVCRHPRPLSRRRRPDEWLSFRRQSTAGERLLPARPACRKNEKLRALLFALHKTPTPSCATPSGARLVAPLRGSKQRSDRVQVGPDAPVKVYAVQPCDKLPMGGDTIA